MEKAKVKANISIENLQIDYDRDADVLYISFGDPKEEGRDPAQPAAVI